MTNQEILKKAIEKAVENGWDKDEAYEAKCNPENKFYFRHDFAQAFWKVDYMWLPQGYPHLCSEWQHHLSQMVLAKEPERYLEKFLK